MGLAFGFPRRHGIAPLPTKGISHQGPPPLATPGHQPRLRYLDRPISTQQRAASTFALGSFTAPLPSSPHAEQSRLDSVL